MALSRRQFLSRTGLATAGMFGSGLWRSPFIRRAYADTIGDRYVISLFLNGGNDGLNTVTPIANGGSGTLRTAYQVARKTGVGGLQLSAAELAATAIGNDPISGTPLALHPGLVGLSSLYNAGHVAVIQGCGYPDYNLSHETSRRTWETAILGGNGNGWIGRYLAQNYGGTDIPALNISGGVAGDFQQNATSVLAADRVAYLEFPYGYNSDSEKLAKRACFNSLYGDAASSLQAALSYTGSAGSATLDATDSYPGLEDLYVADRASFDLQYDTLDKSTGNDLREIAKVMYGVKQNAMGVHARHFELSNGGYDTHSDQGTSGAMDQHYGLHRELGDSLQLFYSDIADMGLASKTLIFVFTEFSRRVTQNDSGTDHGSQGPVFVIGGAVNGGVYGNHPNINAAALDDGDNTVYSQAVADPYRSTDMRDIYGTILKHWLNMSAPTILSSVLTADGGDPDLYWTAPNFDMGFLP